MYAARSLEAGVEKIRQLTGVEAEFGGRHTGAGTWNALASLGTDQYLEIIAPDPEQYPGGTMAEELLDVDSPYIRTWAVAVKGFDTIRPALAQAGYGERVIDMSRKRPDGVNLAWQILFVSGHEFGLTMPFFIDWLQSPHPAQHAPAGMTLTSFQVNHPEIDSLEHFFNQIGLPVHCDRGSASMRARLQTPRGEITLT